MHKSTLKVKVDNDSEQFCSTHSYKSLLQFSLHRLMPVTYLLDMLVAGPVFTQIFSVTVKVLCTCHPNWLVYLQPLWNPNLTADWCVFIDFTYSLQVFHKTDWGLSIVVCRGMCWNSWTETNSYQEDFGGVVGGWKGCMPFCSASPKRIWGIYSK